MISDLLSGAFLCYHAWLLHERRHLWNGAVPSSPGTDQQEKQVIPHVEKQVIPHIEKQVIPHVELQLLGTGVLI